MFVKLALGQQFQTSLPIHILALHMLQKIVKRET